MCNLLYCIVIFRLEQLGVYVGLYMKYDINLCPSLYGGANEHRISSLSGKKLEADLF